jgi:hypothetical protein
MTLQTIDTRIGVVWSYDIDPRASTPLWASVRFTAADPSAPHPEGSTRWSGVVIEVSATPPPRTCIDKDGR